MLSLALNFLPSASISGDKFQAFFNVYLWIGTILFVGTLGVGIYWAIKYKRKHENEETPYIPHNFLVEFVSIFGISVWVAIFFLWGWDDYKYFVSPKLDEYEINVIGQQWSWQMQYAHGKTLVNELYVPINKPVKLVLTSKDVLHSFFVPEFRIKQDLVPGQFTTMRFEANKIGEFHIFCAEYCGTAHSKMLGKVIVLSQEDFQKWVDGVYKAPAKQVIAANGIADEKLTMAEMGARLYKSKTCNACHSLNGAPVVGPTFKGLFGTEVELIGGTKVMADENYIRESIMDPMAKIVKGFPPAMPTYRGQLSDEEVNQLIAFIKSLK